jgi:hypothetical protein
MNYVTSFLLDNSALVKSPIPNKLLMESTYINTLESMCKSLLESLTLIFVALLIITLIRQFFPFVKLKNFNHNQLNSLWKKRVSVVRKS